VKRLHFSNILDFIWTWNSQLKNILDCGWTWTEFLKIRTGSGSQNVTVRLSLIGVAQNKQTFRQKFNELY